MRPTPVYGIVIVLLSAACEQPTCAGRLTDACRKARDMAHAMGVQIADDYADGSPILGDVATMGATGKGAVSIRLTGMQRQAIRVGGQATVRTDSSLAPSAFSSDDKVATAVSIDGVMGAWGGWAVGQTRMGGIDLLGSMIIVPNANHGDFNVRGSPWMFGSGARIGITEETRSLPAISLTGMLRFGFEFSGSLANLPTDSGQSVTIGLNRGQVNSLEYRLAASKKAGKLGVSGGIGRNVYFVTTGYVVDGGALGPGFEDTSFNITRTAAFVGVTYTRDKLTYGAELSRVMGGDLPAMLNTFGDRGATAARNYLSLGVRVPMGRTLDRR